MDNPNTIPYRRYQEIQVSDTSIADSFKQSWDTSNYATALTILTSNAQQLSGKTLNAEAVAKIANGLVTVQSRYDIATRQFLTSGLDHFQMVVDSIRNLQTYSPTMVYVLFNFVWYDNDLYMALGDVPVGNLPTDTTYWLKFDLKGEQGSANIQGVLKHGWSGTTDYVKNDIVVYGNVVYMALQNTRGDTPSTSPNYWAVLYKDVRQGIEVVDELPNSPVKWSIWFLKQ